MTRACGRSKRLVSSVCGFGFAQTFSKPQRFTTAAAESAIEGCNSKFGNYSPVKSQCTVDLQSGRPLHLPARRRLRRLAGPDHRLPAAAPAKGSHEVDRCHHRAFDVGLAKFLSSGVEAAVDGGLLSDNERRSMSLRRLLMSASARRPPSGDIVIMEVEGCKKPSKPSCGTALLAAVFSGPQSNRDWLQRLQERFAKCAARTENALRRRAGQFVRRLRAEACANLSHSHRLGNKTELRSKSVSQVLMPDNCTTKS